MQDVSSMGLFASLALATFLEAAPFLLLGSLLSVLFDSYVSDEFLLKRLPRGRLASVATGLAAGMVLPTCECGVAPIARRMLARGVPPGAAMAYMLAAPVINPLVLASTYVAFRGDWSMVWGRALLVAVPAALVGLALAGKPVGALLRSAGPVSTDAVGASGAGVLLPMAGAHPVGCACGCGHDGPTRPGLLAIMSRTAGEFLEMGKFLLLGCLAAAAVKTFVPTGALLAVQNQPLLAVAAMMLLAVALSVCSESDAFVAASFVGFPPAALLSFVAIGPMFDLKLLAMYGAIFQRRVVVMLALIPSLLVFGQALLWGLWWS